jgi:hypothetical protein
VVFTERGRGGVFRKLGVAHGKGGALSFRPTTALKQARSLVAEVIENGLPRAVITVARFSAPKLSRLTKPRRLVVRRKGTTLRVGWAPVEGATSYYVHVFQGRALLAATITPHLAFRFAKVPRHGKLVVAVAGLNGFEPPGPATRRGLK